MGVSDALSSSASGRDGGFFHDCGGPTNIWIVAAPTDSACSSGLSSGTCAPMIMARLSPYSTGLRPNASDDRAPCSAFDGDVAEEGTRAPAPRCPWGPR